MISPMRQYKWKIDILDFGINVMNQAGSINQKKNQFVYFYLTDFQFFIYVLQKMNY